MPIKKWTQYQVRTQEISTGVQGNSDTCPRKIGHVSQPWVSTNPSAECGKPSADPRQPILRFLPLLRVPTKSLLRNSFPHGATGSLGQKPRFREVHLPLYAKKRTSSHFRDSPQVFLDTFGSTSTQADLGTFGHRFGHTSGLGWATPRIPCVSDGFGEGGRGRGPLESRTHFSSMDGARTSLSIVY